MRQWLIKQRQKPKHVRDNIAFGFASAVTVVVLVGWLVIVPRADVFSTPVVTSHGSKAFSTFFDTVKDQVAGTGSAVSDEEEQSQFVESADTFAPGFSESSLSASSTALQETPVAIMVVPSASSSASSTSVDE